MADLDAESLSGLAAALRGSADALRSRPVGAIAKSLGRIGDRLLDPEDSLRREALEWLGPTSGLSRPMAEAVMDGMAADWTADRLEATVVEDLGGAEALDGFTARGGRSVRALGPELCFQVAAGSVPGVGVTALVRSLLVKAPTLLKPGRADVVLPVLFARALAEADPALAGSLAVVYWPGGAGALEDAALSAADLVVAYGSDETVGELRARTPARARFVGYHHRVGVAVVGREALRGPAPGRVANELAGSVAFFDQRGCVSPQVAYVERGGAESPLDFAERVAAALEELEERLPRGTLDDAEASRLHQTRGTAELEAGAGRGVRVLGGERGAWTVVFDEGKGAPPGCVGRLLRVEAVDDVAEVPVLLAALRGHLQTVGVAGLGDRTGEVAEALGRVGATRVAPLSRVAFPPPWWHHDGTGPLSALVRWVDLET